MTQFLLEGFAENVPKAGKKCWKALQEKERYGEVSGLLQAHLSLIIDDGQQNGLMTPRGPLYADEPALVVP